METENIAKHQFFKKLSLNIKKQKIEYVSKETIP